MEIHRPARLNRRQQHLFWLAELFHPKRRLVPIDFVGRSAVDGVKEPNVVRGKCGPQ